MLVLVFKEISFGSASNFFFSLMKCREWRTNPEAKCMEKGKTKSREGGA